MKRIATYLLCGITLFAAVSCANDDEMVNENTEDNLVSMSFQTGDAPNYDNDTADSAKATGTRTALNPDKSSVTWNANDKISIGYQGVAGNVTQPFSTPTTGSNVKFWGQAAEKNTAYFMMYPYQTTTKIEYKNNNWANYTYVFPKTQTAIANTFDPNANLSVGVIPDRTKPFTAYNLGGLLRFSIEGAANVAQVKILARGQEPLAGDATSQIKFNNNGSISSAPIQFVPNKNTCVLTYAPASGTLAENTDYFVVLPAGKLASGLTLAFILEDGKAIQVKVSNAIEIKRAQTYSLGKLTLNAAKAKSEILRNKGLIEAYAEKVPGIELEADGTLDIYRGDNLEKILSYKGVLEVKDKDNLTSLNELQYYRNVSGIFLRGNKNLAGELNFSKYPQLTNMILLEGSPQVTKVDITGLDKLRAAYIINIKGFKTIATGNNKGLIELSIYGSDAIEEIDASHMPLLLNLNVYSNKALRTINITNSQKLKVINALYDSSLTNIISLEDKSELERFWAAYSKIESYDFTNMPKLQNINLASSEVKELKGLSAAGANLENLQLSNTKLTSLDVSNNPNLKWLDVYGVKGLTTLDLTNNLELLQIRTSLASNLRELKLGNHIKLTELKVAHCKLTELDIRKFQNLNILYAGSQQPNGFLANIVVKMTAAQKTRLEAVKPFVESGNDPRATSEDTNSWVKVVVE